MRKKKLILLTLLFSCFYIPEGRNELPLVMASVAAESIQVALTAASVYFFTTQVKNREDLFKLAELQHQKTELQTQLQAKLDTVENSLTSEEKKRFHQWGVRPLVTWQVAQLTSTQKTTEQDNPVTVPQRTAVTQVPSDWSGWIDTGSSNASMFNRLMKAIKITPRHELNEREQHYLQYERERIRRAIRQELIDTAWRDTAVAQHFNQQPLYIQYKNYIQQVMNDYVAILKEPYATKRILAINAFTNKHINRWTANNTYEYDNPEHLTKAVRRVLQADKCQYITALGITDLLTYDAKRFLIEASVATCVDGSGRIVSAHRGLKQTEQESLVAAFDYFIDHLCNDPDLERVPGMQYDTKQLQKYVLNQLPQNYQAIYKDHISKKSEWDAKSWHRKALATLSGSNHIMRAKTIDLQKVYEHPYNIILLKSFDAVDQGQLSIAFDTINASSLSQQEKVKIEKMCTDYARLCIQEMFSDKIPLTMDKSIPAHVSADPQWNKLPLEAQLAYAYNKEMINLFMERHKQRLSLQKLFSIKNSDQEAIQFIYNAMDQKNNTERISPFLNLLSNTSPDAEKLRETFFDSNGICHIFKSSEFAKTYIAPQNHKCDLAALANRLLSYTSQDVDICAIQQQGLLHVSTASATSNTSEYITHTTSATMCLEALRGNKNFEVPASFNDCVHTLSGVASEQDAIARLIPLSRKATNNHHLKLRTKELHDQVTTLSRMNLSLPQTLAVNRAHGYIQRLETSVQQDFKTQEYIAAIVQGLFGDEKYKELITDKFATDSEFEQAYDDIILKQADGGSDFEVLVGGEMQPPSQQPKDPDKETQEKKKKAQEVQKCNDHKHCEAWMKKIKKVKKTVNWWNNLEFVKDNNLQITENTLYHIDHGHMKGNKPVGKHCILYENCCGLRSKKVGSTNKYGVWKSKNININIPKSEIENPKTMLPDGWDSCKFFEKIGDSLEKGRHIKMDRGKIPNSSCYKVRLENGMEAIIQKTNNEISSFPIF
ncbi:MAG TPA: hypothetical protein QGF02_00760 [Candidatus Babeliales bacterium]|nr:hypothetical protein [Candidatus Babeliales bacterium]